MDHQHFFGKDLCTYVDARSKNVHVKMCTHTFMPCAHMFLHKTMHIVMIVHYYNKTLRFKFRKDQIFRYGYLQNKAEHARKRHKYICEVLTHMCARFCVVCVRMCTDLYQNILGASLLCHEHKFQIS